MITWHGADSPKPAEHVGDDATAHAAWQRVLALAPEGPAAEPKRERARAQRSARLTARNAHVNTLSMDDFRLDEDAVRRLLTRARHAGAEAADAVLARAERGDRLGAEDIAILWYARTIATDTLAAAARARARRRACTSSRPSRRST